MKKLLIFLFGLLAASPVFPQKATEHTQWIQGPVKVDGSLNGWPEDLPRFDSKTRIAYGIANDRQYLYVSMIVPDELMQRKIMTGGMEFRIDTSGEKKYPVCFFFPMPGHWNGDQRLKEPGMPNSAFKNARNTPNKAELSQVRVTGFSKIPDGIIPWHNEYGIEISLVRDKQGSMVYEAAIPFRTFYKEEITAADTLKPFRFQFRIQGVSQSRPANGEGHKDGIEGGGQGSEGRNHMEGGERGQDMEQGPPSSSIQTTMIETNEIKARLKLVFK